jgi:rare lipoprotein A (peptidoglycan hydrolase)
VRARRLQRIVWLAGVTLVAAVGGLALTRRDADGRRTIPTPVAVPGTENGYYTARAAPYKPSPGHPRTACGQPFLKTTEGVAHPVLPCGIRLFIRFHGRDVLTQVVDRGPNGPGRDFDLTKALADRLGLHGTQVVQWRYASER